MTLPFETPRLPSPTIGLTSTTASQFLVTTHQHARVVMAPSTMDMRRLRGEYKTASNTDITIVACDKHEFEAHAEVLDEKCPKLKKNAAKFDVESGRITLSDTFCEYARVIEKVRNAILNIRLLLTAAYSFWTGCTKSHTSRPPIRPQERKWGI